MNFSFRYPFHRLMGNSSCVVTHRFRKLCRQFKTKSSRREILFEGMQKKSKTLKFRQNVGLTELLIKKLLYIQTYYFLRPYVYHGAAKTDDIQ